MQKLAWYNDLAAEVLDKSLPCDVTLFKIGKVATGEVPCDGSEMVFW